MTCSFPPSLFLPQAEVQPFSPTSSSSNNNAATSSVADSNSLNSSSSAKTFVACKVCGDKASGNFSLSSHRTRAPFSCVSKNSAKWIFLFYSTLSGYHYGVTSCEGCKVSRRRKKLMLSKSLSSGFWYTSEYRKHLHLTNTRKIENWFYGSFSKPFSTSSSRLSLVSGILSSEYSEADRVSMFARGKMLSYQTESKPMPIL